jgi:uncharacterized membrane protein YfcA
MSLEEILLFATLALIAEVIGTVGGYGSSMLFVPLAGMFLDFHSVLGVTALFHVASNVSKIALFREGYDRRLVLRVGIPATVAVIVGAYLSRYVSGPMLELGVALMLTVISLFLLLRPSAKLEPDDVNCLAGGAASGLLAGLLGTGGAIRGLVLAAFALPMQVFVSTSAIIDLAVDASRAGVYLYNGYVHRHDLPLLGVLAAVSLMGTWIGRQILGRMPEERFRGIVLVILLLTGLFTTGRTLWQVLG